MEERRENRETTPGFLMLKAEQGKRAGKAEIPAQTCREGPGQPPSWALPPSTMGSPFLVHSRAPGDPRGRPPLLWARAQQPRTPGLVWSETMGLLTGRIMTVSRLLGLEEGGAVIL